MERVCAAARRLRTADGCPKGPRHLSPGGVGVGQADPAERTCNSISFSGIGGLGVTVLTKNLASKANCYYNYGYAHRF